MRTLLILALAVAGTACRRSESHPADKAFYATPYQKRPPVPVLAKLGALAFRDPSLSASGTLACSTCHDPDHAFAPANDEAIQRGGATGTLAGTRATPSLRYLQTVPRFTEHYHDVDDHDDVDQGPVGGLTWDGRAATAHDQARAPLLSPVEMANTSPDEVVAKLSRASYAPQLVDAFGDDVFATTDRAFAALTWCLEVYQQDPAAFYPYSSKYDAVIRKQATLDERETRGKQVFDDPARGNCASCHPDGMTNGFPAFTDFGFTAIGVPRNRTIPANRDPSYFDLGLCGPYRTDLASRGDYCGLFRTPTLRNVATRKRFFHNGAMTSLRDAVAFYATRDVTPARWYGEHGRFDDVPEAYRANITNEVPFGTTRTLDERDIDDLVAFLGTLTDGYR